MLCSACGAAHAEGARFCASCGARLDAPVFHDRPSRPAAGVLCPRCGGRTVPVPYFSRGVNVAKALVFAIPLAIVGPLLFFFWRKDTFICTLCRRVLPFEAPVGLLQAFSQSTTALPPPGYETALTVREKKTKEVARSDAKGALAPVRGRFATATSGVFGLLSGGFATGAAFAVAIDGAAAGPLAGFSIAAGFVAVVAGWRGRTVRRRSREARRKAQVLEVIDLAREHAGRLTVTLVAARMRLELAEAEALLDSMLDGRRVDVQADDRGRVTYVFPELFP